MHSGQILRFKKEYALRSEQLRVWIEKADSLLPRPKPHNAAQVRAHITELQVCGYDAENLVYFRTKTEG